MNIPGCFAARTQTLAAITALVACLLQAGCSTAYTATGTLTTSDNGKLQLSRDDPRQFLQPGATSIDFVPEPLIFPFLILRNPKAEFKTSLSLSHYGYNGFAIDHEASELLYDIAGQWREIVLSTYQEAGTQACTGSGYCEKAVTIVSCPRHGDRLFSDSYSMSDEEEDAGCISQRGYVSDYYYDCPGTQPVSNTMKRFKYGVELHFTEPANAARERARFIGETNPSVRVVDSVPTGSCQTE
jgi:hypothetical protein